MRAEFFDALENLYPDSSVGRRPRLAFGLDVARGGTAAVHVFADGLAEGARVRFEIRSSRGPVPEAEWFRLVDVPVEINTGPVGFVERMGSRNEHVVRRAPFRTYDAMQPAGSQLRAPGETLALRLHVPVAPRARPGERTYTVAVSAGRDRIEMQLTVVVHAARISDVGAAGLPYTNWFNYKLIAERHGLEMWTEPYWRMLGRYARLMARARQNTFWIPLGHVFTVRDGRPALNAARLRRIVRTFTRAGMHFIEGGHFGRRSTGKWRCPTFSVVMTDSPAASARGAADVAAIARQLVAEIDRNGWRDRWRQHVADEPSSHNMTDYRMFAGVVRKYMPGFRILDACIEESAVGALDDWCPQAHSYQQKREFFDAQKALGDRVWFYTCCYPGGPWLNRLLDMELVRPALLGWAAARYDLDGFLHWGLNQYRAEQDPFAQSCVDHGEGNHLPAGDTHVVYPGPKGPWSCVRLESQREGLEDYELLQQLKEKDPAAAKRIIRRALRTMDDYTKNPATLRKARRALLEALETP